MFHIPFQMRTNVVNYRYSISGHPCFYIGSSILSCWEEMHCPALDDLVVSRVEVKENNSVKVIDLRLPENEMMQGDKRKENFKLLMTWPLIIACSIKTITPDAPFKFEYVHPQLLMLALKEKGDECWGVAYTSTHIDPNMSTEMSKYTNIAMPVRRIKEEGYCGELASRFKLSRGISFIEAEIKNVLNAYNNIRFDPYRRIFKIANNAVGTDKYMETKFGKLESYLNKLIQTENIE